ncbi:hypothetical protein EDC56_2478 [Sinobacterium caligoides]|uniref:P pilus assembly chaperone PapD n=1 Tax=Sinobacterium caligoides TaxID=933926 RepID=A0A3N2DQD3_9GAMM|nr:hypothetical protein [Sinobacterium caligoides]ROS02028.1 hypothetical protein EDC56_2478 [Sinobacterium caligoides]
MNKFYLIALLSLFLVGQVQAKNSFLVAPAIINFDMDEPLTQSFIITNDGDEPIRLNIKPVYYPIDSNSLRLGSHLDAETVTIEDITSSIRLSPKRLSLKPGQRRDIRVSIRPKKDQAEGTYRSHILVQMLETAQVIQTVAEGGSSVDMRLSMKMETAVAVYGNKGEGQPLLNFSCRQQEDSDQLLLEVTNSSVWRFDGDITLVTKAQPGEALYEDRLVSMRGSNNPVKIEKKYNPQAGYQVIYASFDQPELKNTVDCAA